MVKVIGIDFKTIFILISLTIVVAFQQAITCDLNTSDSNKRIVSAISTADHNKRT